MMKKAVLVIVSLSIGVVIGYLYRNYRSVGYKEAKGVSEYRKHNVSMPRSMYHAGEEEWEDLIFEECNDFGPVELDYYGLFRKSDCRREGYCLFMQPIPEQITYSTLHIVA